MDGSEVMMGQRGEKRQLPQQQSASEPFKRRAPYATRACDSCRRRKGRCDGRKPCEHCRGRFLECSYSSTGVDERRPNQAGPAPAGSVDPRQTNLQHQQPQPHHLQPQHGQCRDAATAPPTLSSLGGLVTSLQDQLNALATMVKDHQQASAAASATQHQPAQRSGSLSDASSASAARAKSGPKGPTPPFFGPTSPEFSFNAAKITLSQEKEQASNAARQERLPSLREDMSDDEDECSTLLNDSDYASPVAKSAEALQPSRGLLRFANVLSKQEAGRLLGVYQEIIGEIHPICDIDSLTKQLDRWYGWSPGPGHRGSFSAARPDVGQETDELLILGLALATAMSAEAVSRSDLARELYDGFKDTALAKLLAPVTTEKEVVITLMMGFYAYFNGDLHTAWRMCGLAGRLAMQVGMHSREVTQRMEGQGRAAELAAITCSLVTLDRQWSAAAGLPPNFDLSDFDSAQPNTTQNAYLKAMMSFNLMSHRFNDPISRVARGGVCDDDDAFEVTVFKIEQWRRRTLDKQRFTHPLTWESAPATRPASWTTMLYLRANAVRTILLRPFFMSAPSESATKKIKSALEFITDTVTTLSILDRTTDTYRKQHPQFQHFLASACALLFLVVAYVGQNCASCYPDLPPDYAETVRQTFRDALNLSAAYRELSPASRRLWKRLTAMHELLARKNVLPWDESYSKDGSGDSNSTGHDSSSEHNNNNNSGSNNNSGGTDPVVGIELGGRVGANVDSMGFAGGGMGRDEGISKRPNAQLHPQHVAFVDDDQSIFDVARFGMRDCNVSADSLDFAAGGTLGNPQGIADCFGLDWPICDGTTFFTEGGL